MSWIQNIVVSSAKMKTNILDINLEKYLQMTMFRNKEKTATREQSYLNDYKGSTRGEQKSAAPFCRPMAFRIICFTVFA